MSDKPTIDDIISDMSALVARIDQVVGDKPPYRAEHRSLRIARNALMVAVVRTVDDERRTREEMETTKRQASLVRANHGAAEA
jgi:hypothetical protein